jgi:hypothetical protein
MQAQLRKELESLLLAISVGILVAFVTCAFQLPGLLMIGVTVALTVWGLPYSQDMRESQKSRLVVALCVLAAIAFAFMPSHPGFRDADKDGIVDYLDPQVLAEPRGFWLAFQPCYDKNNQYVYVEKQGDRSVYCEKEIKPVPKCAVGTHFLDCQ